MKKLHLLGVAIALTGCIERELPIPAREPGIAVIRYADLGSDYNAQLHVQLHTGEVVADHPKDAWCTRFHFDEDSIWMDLNGSRFMHIAAMNPAMAEGVISQEQADDLPWGVNQPKGRDTSQVVQLGSTWAIDLGRDPGNPIASLGGVRVECLTVESEEVVLRVSDLVSEQPDTLSWDTIWVTHDQNVSQTHLSLLKREVVDIEPPTGTWELYFTQYTTLFETEDGEPLEYLVTGVLSHAEGVRVFQPDEGDWEFWKEAEWNPENWDENWDIIGWDWKEYSIAEDSYTIFSDAVYCIVTAEGREFLLRFIDFYDDTGATGRITYETLER